MHNEKIIKAIQSSGRLNKAQAATLEILYKTSINGESDVKHEFIATFNNCSKAYVSKTLKELVELEFISFKYPKGNNNQVYILNNQMIDLLTKSYDLQQSI